MDSASPKRWPEWSLQALSKLVRPLAVLDTFLLAPQMRTTAAQRPIQSVAPIRPLSAAVRARSVSGCALAAQPRKRLAAKDAVILEELVAMVLAAILVIHAQHLEHALLLAAAHRRVLASQLLRVQCHQPRPLKAEEVVVVLVAGTVQAAQGQALVLAPLPVLRTLQLLNLNQRTIPVPSSVVSLVESPL